MVDYLGFEVLDGQPPEVREFLLATSILDRLCGPLCDRGHRRARGPPRCSTSSSAAGLLVLPLDTRREWYRYHHLLAGLLRHELARTRPEAVAALHRRAAAWFRSAGAAGAAIRHAIAGGDVAGASELITEHWYAYLQRGRIATVAGWLDALGDEAVRGEASLCLTKAWIAVNTGRLDEVAALDRGRRSGRAPTAASSSRASRACRRSTSTWAATSTAPSRPGSGRSSAGRRPGGPSAARSSASPCSGAAARTTARPSSRPRPTRRATRATTWR